MDSLSGLPIELVLIVAEHAAQSFCATHKRWVASLRLISRAFRTVVTAVLYDTLEVNTINLDALADLAKLPHTPLAATRGLVFATSSIFDASDDSFQTFTGALRDLRAYTGDSVVLIALLDRHPNMRLSSAFITDATSAWHVPHAPLTDAVSVVPRLHVIVSVFDEPLLPPTIDLERVGTQYLVLDAFSSRDRGDVGLDVLGRFVERLAALLRMPALRRLLLRPRLEHAQNTATFCQALTAWARDPRVWLDDRPVENHGLEGNDWYDELDSADALCGDELWLAGFQVFFPEKKDA